MTNEHSTGSAVTRIAGAIVLVLFAASVRFCVKLTAGSMRAKQQANAGPVFFLENGAVEASLPPGWSLFDTSASRFGPGFLTSATLSRKDGAWATLGIPRVQDTTLASTLTKTALIDACFPAFAERARAMNLEVSWSAATHCREIEPQWILCGGDATAKTDQHPWSAFFQVRRIDDRWLVAVTSRAGALTDAESVELVRSLKL